MEKDEFSREIPPQAPRLTLAEEQRQDFEADRRRERKPILTLRLSGLILRN